MWGINLTFFQDTNLLSKYSFNLRGKFLQMKKLTHEDIQSFSPHHRTVNNKRQSCDLTMSFPSPSSHTVSWVWGKDSKVCNSEFVYLGVWLSLSSSVGAGNLTLHLHSLSPSLWPRGLKLEIRFFYFHSAQCWVFPSRTLLIKLLSAV